MKSFPIRNNKDLIIIEIFLSMFGLTFEEDDLPMGKPIALIDEKKEAIGSILYDNKGIQINTKTDLGLLSAEIPNTKRWMNFINSSTMVFKTSISYEINSLYDKRIKGECSIKINIDASNVAIEKIEHKLSILKNNKKIVSIETGELDNFRVTFYKNGSSESIRLRPYAIDGKYVIYDFLSQNEKDNCDNHFLIERCISNRTKFHIIKRIKSSTQNSTKITSQEEFIDKEKSNDNSKHDKQFIIQLGSIMESFMPNIRKTLTSLRSILKKGNTYFLDEIINSCLPEFEKEEIESLFGFTPTLEKSLNKHLTYTPNKQ